MDVYFGKKMLIRPRSKCLESVTHGKQEKNEAQGNLKLICNANH